MHHHGLQVRLDRHGEAGGRGVLKVCQRELMGMSFSGSARASRLKEKKTFSFIIIMHTKKGEWLNLKSEIKIKLKEEKENKYGP